MIITFMVCDGISDEDCPPGRKCIVKCQDRCKKLDVMVKPGQRIREVYKRFSENNFLPSLHEGGQMSVYSLRRKEYVNPSLTFWQEKIYAGDILVIREIRLD